MIPSLRGNKEAQTLPPFVKKFLEKHKIQVQPVPNWDPSKTFTSQIPLEKSIETLIQARTYYKISCAYIQFLSTTFDSPAMIQQDYQQFIYPFFVHLALQLFKLGKNEEAMHFIQQFRGIQPPQCLPLIHQLEKEQGQFKPPHFNIQMNKYASEDLMLNIERWKQVLLSGIITTNINITEAPYSHPLLFIDSDENELSAPLSALSTEQSIADQEENQETEQINSNAEEDNEDNLEFSDKVLKNNLVSTSSYLSSATNPLISNSEVNEDFSFAKDAKRLSQPILSPIPEDNYMPPTLSVTFHPEMLHKQPSIDQYPDGRIYLTQALPDIAHIVEYNHNNRINDMRVSRCARIHAMAQDSSVVVSSLDSSTGFNDSNSSVLTNHAGKVLTVAFSDDTRYIVSGGMDCQVKVAHVEAFRPYAHFRNHIEPILSVAWDPRPSSPFFASASLDRTTSMWSLSSPTILRLFIGHTLPVTNIVFSKDGSSLLSASSDSTLRIWDIGTGKMISKFQCGRSIPLTIDVHPNNQFVACGCEDGRVILWDASTTPNDAHGLWCQSAFDSRVTDVKFSEDGSLLLASSIDGEICAFNLKDENKSGTIMMRTNAYASTIDSITVTRYNLVCTTGRSLRGGIYI